MWSRPTAFSLIAAVEDVITLPELAAMGEARRPKVAKIAAGYGAWLRFAGCRVTDAEVFSSIYSTAVTPASAMEHIAALMSVLMPSDIRKATVEQLEKIVAAQGGLPGKSAHAPQQIVKAYYQQVVVRAGWLRPAEFWALSW